LAKELAPALADALKSMPAPEVNVDNVVQLPGEGPREVTFERDRQGRITGATIEDA
jgi:hypothetical protein